MKLRSWINVIISIIMLIFSGYLLADSSVMSLDLLSNPNLNVAIELIRLFWGVVGLLYFLYYLYENVENIFFTPVTISPKTTSTKKGRSRKGKQKRKSSRKSKAK